MVVRFTLYGFQAVQSSPSQVCGHDAVLTCMYGTEVSDLLDWLITVLGP